MSLVQLCRDKKSRKLDEFGTLAFQSDYQGGAWYVPRLLLGDSPLRFLLARSNLSASIRFTSDKRLGMEFPLQQNDKTLDDDVGSGLLSNDTLPLAERVIEREG